MGSIFLFHFFFMVFAVPILYIYILFNTSTQSYRVYARQSHTTLHTCCVREITALFTVYSFVAGGLEEKKVHATSRNFSSQYKRTTPIKKKYKKVQNGLTLKVNRTKRYNGISKKKNNLVSSFKENNIL